MPTPLHDLHGRRINYLRLAVTDRCNLRCRYCRPSSSSPPSPRTSLLSFEELGRLARLFADMGIAKIRLTGGEPFMRHDLLRLLAEIREIPGIDTLYLTTNGVHVAPHLTELLDIGVSGLNLSLDTLSPQKFQAITGVDAHAAVMATLHGALDLGLPLKINTVVQDGVNTDELLDLVEFARHHPVQVRFIEPMPFGMNSGFAASTWTVSHLKDFFLKQLAGCVELLPAEGSTALLLKVKNFQGAIGIIGGHSRSFCASCNKVRVTPQGILKNCLYDDGVLDLRQLLRDGKDDAAIRETIRAAVLQRRLNGKVVEQERAGNDARSMAMIGG